jgi:hypothetical protein
MRSVFFSFSGALAKAKWLMAVDPCLLLEFNGNSKTLMRDLLPDPSALSSPRQSGRRSTLATYAASGVLDVT